MKAMDINVKHIWNRTYDLIKACWSEVLFIQSLSVGLVAFVYLLVIFAGMMLGKHASSSLLPIFRDVDIPFVIIAVLLPFILYTGAIPLHYGIRWFYWQAAGGARMPLSSIFACYSSPALMRHCLDLHMRRVLFDLPRILVCGVLCLGIHLAYTYAEDNMQPGFLYDMLLPLDIFLITVMVLVCILACAQAKAASYIFAENPNMSAKEIMRTGRRLFRIDYMRSVRVLFSGSVLYVLAPLVFPLAFVIPLNNIIGAIYFREVYKGRIE